MQNGRETWWLREKEFAILRIEKAMCGVKLLNRKNTNKLMDMLGLDKTMNKMAKTNGVRCYEHVLRREDGDVLWKTLKFKLDGQKKRGRPKMSYERGILVQKEIGKVGLKKDASNQTNGERE